MAHDLSYFLYMTVLYIYHVSVMWKGRSSYALYKFPVAVFIEGLMMPRIWELEHVTVSKIENTSVVCDSFNIYICKMQLKS